MTQAQVSACVRALRWLSGELTQERHPLAHVPRQVADAMLREPVGACRLCGGELPAPLGVGRRRVRCESCSPPRRKLAAKCTVVPVDDPPIEEVA